MPSFWFSKISLNEAQKWTEGKYTKICEIFSSFSPDKLYPKVWQDGGKGREERKKKGKGGLISWPECQTHLLPPCLILGQDLFCIISTTNRHLVDLMVVNMSTILIAQALRWSAHFTYRVSQSCPNLSHTSLPHGIDCLVSCGAYVWGFSALRDYGLLSNLLFLLKKCSSRLLLCRLLLSLFFHTYHFPSFGSC